MIRSKAKCIEGWEKCTKYFVKLEKRNYQSKCIESLINGNNKTRTGDDVIKRM